MPVESRLELLSDKFLPVCVCRNVYLGDCTNGGVTSKHSTLYLPHPRGTHHRKEIDPEQILIPGSKGGVANFVPLALAGRWSMAGGNFVITNDSRFADLYGRQPVSVHDRIET